MALNGYGMPRLDFRSLAEIGQAAPQAGLSLADLGQLPPAAQKSWAASVANPDGSMTGRGSWYSQFQGKNNWVDREDRPGSNALGVADANQGIALPSRKTLGQWFDVTGPDGNVHRLQQTDIGPAGWTGKGIDISAAAAERMGFTPKNFPTGGHFSWRPAR